MSTLKSSYKLLLAPIKSAKSSSRRGSKKSENLSNPKMEIYSQQLANNPDVARRFLESAGIITAHGHLRKVFGG